MKQKTILISVVFLFSLANIAAADTYYNKTKYDIFNQTWNMSAWDDSGKSIDFGFTSDAYKNQSLLRTDWNYSFNSANNSMTFVGDVDYIESYGNDLIFKPTNVMFDKTDFYFRRDFINGTIPDNETLTVALALFIVIIGSLSITWFIWLLQRHKII